MDVEMMDLPNEVLSEILKKVESCPDIGACRSVSRLWCAMINLDHPRSVRYLVNRRTMNEVDNDDTPKFSDHAHELCGAPALRKMAYRFEQVDLSGSEDYWTRKGADVTTLDFDESCLSIPLEHVLSKCINLSELRMHDSDDLVERALQALAARQARNNSLQVLQVTADYAKTVDEAIALVRLVDRVFPRIERVTLIDYEDAANPHEMEQMTRAFRGLRFRVQLKAENEVVFDPETAKHTPAAAVTVKTLTVDHVNVLSHADVHAELKKLRIHTRNNYTFGSTLLEQVLKRYSSLDTLDIECGCIESPGRPLQNRLRSLRLEQAPHTQALFVDRAFFQTFRHLRKLRVECDTSAETFGRILSELPHLRSLAIAKPTSPNTVPDDRREWRPESIAHQHLTKLIIPAVFLRQMGDTELRLNRLTELTLEAESYDPQPITFLREVGGIDLKSRFRCPRLQTLTFGMEMNPKAKFSRWLKEILSAFPTLRRFHYRLKECAMDRQVLSDAALMELIQKFPNLVRVQQGLDDGFDNDGFNSRISRLRSGF